jgi:hypothetical protein
VPAEMIVQLRHRGFVALLKAPRDIHLIPNSQNSG